MSLFPVVLGRGALVRLLSAATVVTLCSACMSGSILGDGDWNFCPNGNEPVGRIELKPAAPSLRVGDELLLSSQVYKPDGSLLVFCVNPVTFTIDDANVATVQRESGQLRGMKVGQTTLRATVGGATASAPVTVTSNALAKLDVTPSSPTLQLGEVGRVSASARDSAGADVRLQSTPWTSADPAVATVTSLGTVVARGIGTTTVSLTSGGLTASAAITVENDPPTIRMTSLSVGANHSCAIAGGGTVAPGTAFCWGTSVQGNGTLTPANSRVPGDISFRSISAGHLVTCGISTADVSYCWGWNSAGELGSGNRTAHFTPQRVSGGATYQAVVAADMLACGLLSTGRVHCWGASNLTEAILVPTPLAGALTFVELTGGTGGPGGVCGRTAAGTVHCWTRLSRWHAAAPVPASGSGYVAVSGGGLYQCGLSATGSASCWGRIRYELAPSVSSAENDPPVAVPGGLTYRSIAAGGNFFCGITEAGTWCLGPTGLSTAVGPLPHRVPTLDPQTKFVQIAAGAGHACALDTRGAVWCWGRGQSLGFLELNEPSQPLRARFD